MMTIPEIIGISDLRSKQNEVLSRLHKGPVVLVQHSRPVAVLVSPDLWNQILERLADAEDALDVVEAHQAKEPTTSFDDYLTGRGEGVPTSS